MIHRVISLAILLSATMLMSAQTISRYEYWLGTDHSQLWTVAGDEVDINLTIPTDVMEQGLQVLNFRVQNSDGDWSSIQRMLFYIPEPSESAADVTGWEWWLDDQVQARRTGKGDLTAIEVSSDVSSLPVGLHCLNFRVQNSHGDWSSIQRMLFYIPEPSESAADVTGWEWWFDDQVQARRTGKGDLTAIEVSSDVSSLSVGLHCLNFRVQNSHGDWSAIQRMLFLKSFEAEQTAQMAGVEYWIDEDYSHCVREQTTMLNYSFVMDISTQKVGLHTLSFRVRNTNGDYSPVSRFLFYVPEESDDSASPCVGYCYAFNGTATYVAIGEQQTFELKDLILPIPELSEIGNVESGCTFTIDHQNGAVLLDRTQSVTFALWFVKKNGAKSSPVSTTFELTDNLTRTALPLKLGLTKTLGQLDGGDYQALSFNLTSEQELTFTVSSPVKLRLYNSEGSLLNAVSLADELQFSLPSGSYYAVVSHSALDHAGLSRPLTVCLKSTSGDNEEEDDLQDYLNSLIDTEDEFANNTYRREFRNGDWQSLYVPFEIAYSDWSEQFEVARLSKLNYIGGGLLPQGESDIEGFVELEATKVESGSIAANYPYLIRSKSVHGATLSVNGIGDITENYHGTTLSDGRAVSLTFYGNYHNKNGMKESKSYRLQGGFLSVPYSDHEVLPPYRWYAQATLNNSPVFSRLCIAVVSEQTTGITSGPSTTDDRSLRVYNLSGNRVGVMRSEELNLLPKGVYIINGRKYTVK